MLSYCINKYIDFEFYYMSQFVFGGRLAYKNDGNARTCQNVALISRDKICGQATRNLTNAPAAGIITRPLTEK